MLSRPVSSAPADSVAGGVVDWLPDFGPPAISLDLSPLSSADPALDPAAASAASPQKPGPDPIAASTPVPVSASAAAPVRPSTGSIDTGDYAHIGDYAGMVSEMGGYLLGRGDDSNGAYGVGAASTDDASSASVSLTAPAQRQCPPPASDPLDEQGDGPQSDVEPAARPSDHEGPPALCLSFDFHTDPAIDAIASAPLFPLATPLFPLATPLFPLAAPAAPAAATAAAAATVAVPSTTSVGKADDVSTNSSPLSAQPQIIPLADAAMKSGSSERVVTESARKARGRRTSFAGMLMRRASKYVEMTAGPGSREAVQQSPSHEEVLGAPTAASAVLSVESMASTSAPHEVAEQPSSAAEQLAEKGPNATLVEGTGAATDCPGTTPGTKDAMAAMVASAASGPQDEDAVGAASQPGSSTDDIKAGDDSADTSMEDVAAPPVSAAHTSSSAEVDTSARNASASREFESEGSVPSGAAERAADSGESASSASNGLLPPPKIHSLEKRSSRIINGITRKVNYVRQTTSMVLRRSVGSRLPMAPGSPLGTSTQLDPSVAELEADEENMLKDTQKPSLEDSTREAADASDRSGELESMSIRSVDGDAGNAAAAPSTEMPGAVGEAPYVADVARDAAAESSDNESIAAASAPDAEAEAETKPETKAEIEAEASASAAATSDKDGLEERTTSFSRRLGLVRRGTNEAVRSSVSRVKSMFTAKRPVAA
ncbi:hypothetical protein LPJ61_001187 [Coemansia biformis]|uniref:Uncharacterized protein n=1 Tax=Coemansia biformis TaxID=1286918 RepID=A0A9W7YEU0_9FUNG|nr:hypothetical protein LPJ61_001187 [Coemansia biformis]